MLDSMRSAASGRHRGGILDDMSGRWSHVNSRGVRWLEVRGGVVGGRSRHLRCVWLVEILIEEKGVGVRVEDDKKRGCCWTEIECTWKQIYL
jgi:hypothetical protein